MVATVAIPFESLPVKRRKLQSEQQKRRSQETASSPSSDDEEIVVTVEEEEEEEEREHPKRRCHGRPLPPSKDELPLDLSSKTSESSVKLFQPTLPTNASLWPHPSALMTSAVPLFFSFYPAWSTLPYLYAAAPFAGTVLSPVNALNTRQLPTVSSSPDISPKSSLLSSASPSSPSSSSLPSSPPSSLVESTTAATKHRKARNPVVRRMVANARERCRVHMISEAFEALRVALPSACPAQKLTKVSILRIACDYIMLLGAMNGRDYSADQRSPSVDELQRQLSETILAETNFKCV